MPWLASGVYCLLNLVNKKRYVGSSEDLKRRTRQHVECLRSGRHENSHLQRAWRKYGGENFKIVYLQRCSVDKCLEKEQWWMDHYRSTDSRYGYNKSPVAGTVRGIRWKRTEEHHEFMLGVLRSYWNSPAGIKERRKRSKERKGKKLTGKHLANLRAGCKVRSASLAYRKKISVACMGRNKGKTYEEIYGAEKAAEIRKKQTGKRYSY